METKSMASTWFCCPYCEKAISICMEVKPSKAWVDKSDNSLLQNSGEKHNKDVVNTKKYNNGC